MSGAYADPVVEDASLVWLNNQVLDGPDIASGEPAARLSDPSLYPASCM